MPRRNSVLAAARAVLACAVAALVLTACGGDDDSPPPAAEVPTATQAAPPADTDTSTSTTEAEPEEPEPEDRKEEPAPPEGLRAATADESRAIREAVGDTCETEAKFAATAVSGEDPRYALYDFDDQRATTVCAAIMRRAEPGGGTWKVVRSSKGLAAFDQAVAPCPEDLPEDLRGTVNASGGDGPIVFCGN
jgi:hypothetical protein